MPLHWYGTFYGVIPAAIWALGFVLFIQSPWHRKVVPVPFAGVRVCVCAYYGSGWFSALTGMPETLSGFLTGIFSMPVVDKAIEEIYEMGISPTIINALKKRLGSE